MRRETRVVTLAILTAVLASGCASGYLRVSLPSASPGTVSVGGESVPMPAEPYPFFMGTLFDAGCVVWTIQDVSGLSNAQPELGTDPAGEAMLAPFCLVDFPFSFFLDTSLSPLDGWAHWRYAQAKRRDQARVDELTPASPSPPAGNARTIGERALHDPDPEGRARAARELGSLGTSAVAPLVRLLNDTDPRVRASAARALGRGGIQTSAGRNLPDRVKTKLLVPALAKALHDADRDVVIAAAQALAALGEVHLALPGLIAGFRDPDASVRATTAQEMCVNMASLGPADEAATPALIEALGDSVPTVSLCAADALARIGPSAVLPLVEALRSENPTVQQRAQYALLRIVPTLVPAIPALLRAAKTDSRPDDIIAMVEARDVRDGVATWQHVCSLLGRIGPDAAPALVVALDDPDGSVRLCAAMALLDIGAPPRAVPALRRRLKDPEPQIRRVARAALERGEPLR